MSSQANKAVQTSDEIVKFYRDHLTQHGDSARGVGWKDHDAQYIRFRQLATVISDKTAFTINDFGCGTGKFYNFLIQENFSPAHYYGYDILDEMLAIATENLSGEPATFVKISQSSEMTEADYSIASGVFNVKYDASESQWMHYILTTIDDMNKNSKRGFAFNLLTSYSDKEFMQSYLYYGNPSFYFDYCKRNFSKNVALLHDYSQYDFTIIVRKN
jgi:SAM-dependent methyltransferase